LAWEGTLLPSLSLSLPLSLSLFLILCCTHVGTTVRPVSRAGYQITLVEYAHLLCLGPTCKVKKLGLNYLFLTTNEIA
jgi:hypothetical protein